MSNLDTTPSMWTKNGLIDLIDERISDYHEGTHFEKVMEKLIKDHTWVWDEIRSWLTEHSIEDYMHMDQLKEDIAEQVTEKLDYDDIYAELKGSIEELVKEEIQKAFAALYQTIAQTQQQPEPQLKSPF